VGGCATVGRVYPYRHISRLLAVERNIQHCWASVAAALYEPHMSVVPMGYNFNPKFWNDDVIYCSEVKWRRFTIGGWLTRPSDSDGVPLTTAVNPVRQITVVSVLPFCLEWLKWWRGIEPRLSASVLADWIQIYSSSDERSKVSLTAHYFPYIKSASDLCCLGKDGWLRVALFAL